MDALKVNKPGVSLRKECCWWVSACNRGTDGGEIHQGEAGQRGNKLYKTYGGGFSSHKLFYWRLKHTKGMYERFVCSHAKENEYRVGQCGHSHAVL